MHTGGTGWGEGGRRGDGERLNLYGGEETIHTIDMEDMEGNVQRADAWKTFQAEFLFLIHCFHHPNKIQSRIPTTQLLIL